MAIPRQLRAVKGQKILPVLLALLKYIDGTGIVRGPGVRMMSGPHGTQVWADSQWNPWDHPFRTSSAGDKIEVRSGTVGGVFPYIGEVNISGVDEDGAPVPIPRLEIKPVDGGISYVALEVAPSEEDGVLVDLPESVRIVHTDDITPAADRVTRYPLALIKWTDKGKIRSIFQVVHHNLGHAWQPAEPAKGTPPRHLFWAV